MVLETTTPSIQCISDGSFKIHKEYGTKTPPEILFDDMSAVFTVSDWGFYES